MSNKKCPICGNESWAMDHYEYGTGWTFCGNCYQSARQSGMFKKIDAAIREAREYHNASIIVEIPAGK